MDVILISAKALLPLFAFMMLGYYFQKRSYLSESTTKQINIIVFRYFLSIMCAETIYKANLKEDVELLPVLMVAGGIISIFLLSWLIVPRFVKDKTAVRKASELRRAILKGNSEKIEQLVQDYLMSSLSFHDLTEEKDYHNVFLGLVYIATDNYSIKSNRESGEGRYDIAMFPKRNNLPGIIFELKHCSDGESIKTDKAKLEQLLTKSAEEALKQIESNEYLKELKESGANPIFKYGATFCGKKAKVVRKN